MVGLDFLDATWMRIRGLKYLTMLLLLPCSCLDEIHNTEEHCWHLSTPKDKPGYPRRVCLSDLFLQTPS
jgi:hypothetical protein